MDFVIPENVLCTIDGCHYLSKELKSKLFENFTVPVLLYVHKLDFCKDKKAK